ncbi:hypothetical protein R1sor_006636 [Riccia sorocarpa]|uniref:Uncharacterized protein n=1 Tax=Riccia sorocarpa TaxID=122646 RepID=A0ABD3HN05_9MARC
MKDNVKLPRPQWSVGSIVRRLIAIPRVGLRQQGIGNFLFAIVAALLIVCIVWGPNASFTRPSISPKLHYKFLSSFIVEEHASNPADAAAARTVHRADEELHAKKSNIFADGSQEDDKENELQEESNELQEESNEKDNQESPDVEDNFIPDEADGDRDGDGERVKEGPEDKKENAEEKTVTKPEGEEKLKSVEVQKEPRKSIKSSGKKRVPLLNSDGKWNTASFRFSPKYADWDTQRADYLKNNSTIRAPVGRNSRVMLVSSTSPLPCERTTGSYLYIMAAKNKIDYTRLHDIQFYYDLSVLDPDFDGLWNKIALLRMLMVKHPEVDWFWWVDMDSWIADMTFEIPFDKYAADGKNLFFYGDEHLLFDEKSWVGISTGDFGIRNCQWSLDLLDAWASFGIKGIREEAGKFLTQNLPGRSEGFPADDQSALAYLLVYQKEKWAPKVVLETKYILAGYWPDLTPKYEELIVNNHPGLGDHRWPFCISFAGCRQCSKVEDSKDFSWETCFSQMVRTYDFANSQVLPTMGFKLVGKLGGKGEVVPLHGEQPARVEASRECPSVRGTHFLLKALKNKIDYARMHDFDFFYNMDNLDKELLGWWMKIPIIRAMLLAHPEAEWIWWVDSDAVFTDLIFEPPFEKYTNPNLVLWGDDKWVFGDKSFIGLNAGIMIVRNCQWSIDFLDSFIPMGPNGDVREQYGDMLTKFMTQRPVMQADDQSAIIYKLNTERERWAPKVFFETTFSLSGSWHSYTHDFEKMMAEHSPGFGDWRSPLITHFAGCQPCSPGGWSNFDVDRCYGEMDRSLHFADNQLLNAYDLEHQSLGTWELQKFSKAQTN